MFQSETLPVSSLVSLWPFIVYLKCESEKWKWLSLPLFFLQSVIYKNENTKMDIYDRYPPHQFYITFYYSLATPVKEGRGREALAPLRWSHWLDNLLKCAVYMSVLNVLTLRGTVEQLAPAVPERLTRGSRAHSVSCRQIPTNKGTLGVELICITYITFVNTHDHQTLCSGARNMTPSLLDVSCEANGVKKVLMIKVFFFF